MSLPDGQRTIGPHFVADADLAGLLFDCDGTLIDTMPLFYHSWAEVCPQHGLSMSEDDFYGFAGKPLPDIVREMHRAQKGTDATDAFVAAFLAEKKRAHLQAEEKIGAPAPIACVVALARGALARGEAANRLREHVERHLESAGLADIFNSRLGNVVCAAEAHAAGCHVVDVTSMAGYPSCDGLRRAKQAAEASRAWLSPPGAAAVPP
ncbi:hypothetical protein EMIHUDRAFT_196023 [Emiliania huxleyi CCMP1516]|uniref:Uncharacterized protein n=2 Tax=Emiliania huxleyi TaxID=2903 RepID=A0A0D3J3C1_EMIH1|nr:hypothetical protein EMIHUDRAFT_196023 [Emiliania huxleyi CCMP1516]EOD18006.1 hypothetical protein EMIHUDRAFT_196023 [Emiliania huxleyi CCMP1516]|eukprot:XP_005770435.1 hypothetical protein EMIHUDRAFT_196023 [Emiliania huxleyi CCMP1516]